MLKPLIITVFFSFTGICANAQVDSAKAAKAKAALIDTVCQCVSKTDVTTIKTADAAEKMISMCFMTDGMSAFVDYLTAAGLDITNMESIQSASEKIGIELSLKCPAIIKAMMNVAKDPAEMDKLMKMKTE